MGEVGRVAGQQEAALAGLRVLDGEQGLIFNTARTLLEEARKPLPSVAESSYGTESTVVVGQRPQARCFAGSFGESGLDRVAQQRLLLDMP
jgi:hypothetical protein